MYILKQIPQDFIVREISSVKLEKSGSYTYFLLRKKNRNTLDVIKQLAHLLHISEKQIGFAGGKDNHAITQQVCSIQRVGKEKLERLSIPDVEISIIGYGNTPISLGDLDGNQFEIVVRNLTKEKIDVVHYFPNYFDEQRFSTNNVKIGKALLRKNFKEAAILLDNPLCQTHLKDYPNDAVGALKKLPIRLLRLYVNSYQSYIWNETLALYLRKSGKIVQELSYSCGTLVFTKEIYPNLEIPIIGFNSPTAPNAEINNIITSLTKQENITSSDFIIKPIPELTLEGEMRKGFAEIQDVKINPFEHDELNAGKKKVLISFTLGKGSYATMVIRTIFK